ncbi:MAG TPA: PEP-CTERM sorting domain-containing protein [Bryobacteraceae bacterium]|nr:PEP-CTERM sorting domain-containing protein [Bryobacteraceae bacterium]
MIKVLGRVSACAVLLFMAATSVSAAVVYDLHLPANGNVDAIHVQVTLPTYAINPLLIFDVNDPEVTAYSTGSLPLPFGVVGIDAQPLATLIGFALADDQSNFATLNPNYPGDFFVFNRLPDENGSFFSVAGTIAAVPPYVLDTATPTAQLIVSAAPIPEPASVLSFSTGAIIVGAILFRRRYRGANC